MRCAERSTACTLASRPALLSPTDALPHGRHDDDVLHMSASTFLSVPQRLPGFQHVRDALLRFFRTRQPQERLALQIEDVLLGDGTRRSIAAVKT